MCINLTGKKIENQTYVTQKFENNGNFFDHTLYKNVFKTKFIIDQMLET